MKAYSNGTPPFRYQNWGGNRQILSYFVRIYNPVLAIHINSKLMPIAINVSTSGLLDTIQSEDVTVDLTPYKFENVPIPLLKGTQLGTADVISISRTIMKIKF